MFHFCNIAKALGDENRLRIIMALRHCPVCVCQLTALLDLSPSTTSKHLSILRQAQLIECVKNGRWTYYQLPQTQRARSVTVRRGTSLTDIESKAYSYGTRPE